MDKITNISENEITLVCKYGNVPLHKGESVIINSALIINLAEIRRDIVIGENLGEVPKRDGNVLYG